MRRKKQSLCRMLLEWVNISMWAALWAATWGLFLGTARADASLGSTRQSVVYREDNRVEVYQARSEIVRAVARRATVALIEVEMLQGLEEGSTPSLRNSSAPEVWCDGSGACGRPCADEPFRDQPVAPVCTGVLVDDDLVLTAGHCFLESERCDEYRYVFDWFYEEPGVLAPMQAEAVYSCRQIVLRADDQRDFALIQLDRPVDAARQPVPLRERPLSSSTPINVIGFPAGLPAKVEEGASVRENVGASPWFFEAATDTFGGSSGGPALDNEGRLVGHLIEGNHDFVSDDDEGC